jgi:ATP-binding cassette subfamily F protein 3
LGQPLFILNPISPNRANELKNSIILFLPVSCFLKSFLYLCTKFISMISVDGLTVEFGGTTLFENISFQVNEKDRIALMGKNGAGKSTLLKILAGERPPTKGAVSAPKDAVICYLPQHLMTEDSRTVFEEASLAFAEIFRMEQEIEKLNRELSERTDYESDSYMQLIEEVSTLSEKFYSIEETNFAGDVEKTLLGLGFSRDDLHKPTSQFSGGWRMRIELAKILLRNPDVILLDEPTNHLDIESIQWLEDFLINSAKAVIVISHDRAFVDNITTRTIEVTMGRIYDYKVNYSHYLELRKERRAQQQKAFEEQQKMIAENKEFIERFKGTYSKTLQVQSRVKMLEKLELIEVDEEDTSALRLKFPPSPRSGSYPVVADQVGKCYGDNVVFRNASFMIERGDKVAFVGKNGEGKSTLVKCIMEEIVHEGSLTLGHNVMIGYFAQNQASLLDENLTVFQTIDNVAKGDIRNKIKDLLGAFMFGGDNSTKKVKVLSGGERTRLAMIKLLLEPVNLLILDEPTNHLDMKTKDILKSALKDFDGTLILVSHDRDFLDGLVTKVYEFGNKKVTEHLETIYGFLQKKKMENLKELERKN